uniref:Uncharacterized protein n=1 Tax=Arion vulgaris TaxID=1028688 RepID=A0A0B7BLM5_9EUPU
MCIFIAEQFQTLEMRCFGKVVKVIRFATRYYTKFLMFNPKRSQSNSLSSLEKSTCCHINYDRLKIKIYAE